MKTDKATKPYAILGEFSGECADASITNTNGLDITYPVWTSVFESEDYANALKHGWYIGFLGHPEDVGCMDFEHACIVMTECHIDANGKVQGKFNLIDNPVGRVVKSFIDAGVQFGISVRGAGDIVNNSVEPGTFVFRGFDLVTFPAFPESIPTFSEIAASTDLDKQIKYKSVCKTLKDNLQDIKSCEAIDVLESQFAAQSDEYKALEARKEELLGDEPAEDIANLQYEALMALYLQTASEKDELAAQLASLSQESETNQIACNKRIEALKRISAAQTFNLASKLDAVSASADSYKHKYQTVVAASTKLKSSMSDVQNQNLKYKQRIEASSNLLADKDKVISSLKTQLAETVNCADDYKARTSNLDVTITQLKSQVLASERNLKAYQDAYAQMYANAIGSNLTNVKITASTSIKDLQASIGDNVNSSELSSVFVLPQPVELVDDTDDDDIDAIVTT